MPPTHHVDVDGSDDVHDNHPAHHHHYFGGDDINVHVHIATVDDHYVLYLDTNNNHIDIGAVTVNYDGTIYHLTPDDGAVDDDLADGIHHDLEHARNQFINDLANYFGGDPTCLLDAERSAADYNALAAARHPLK